MIVRAAMTAIVIALLFSGIIMMMWQAAVDVSEGEVSGGTIAAFVTGALVAGSFGALTEVYGELLRGAGAAGRLAELLAEVPQIRAPANPTPLPEPAEGRLAFEGVTFRYPTRPDVSALIDLDLEVRPGETLAVVGPSGPASRPCSSSPCASTTRRLGACASTASTCAKSIRPRRGARIGFVPQETVIFAASARDNLRYGRWEASDDALWEAADAANAAEFLRRLPEGLDTYLGEGGARLSGGQRQRIAIARALLRDAPLLLLDEATSSLDARSERLVQASLERLFEGRTTIVIAHRLATVRAADRSWSWTMAGSSRRARPQAGARGGGLYRAAMRRLPVRLCRAFLFLRLWNGGAADRHGGVLLL